jgi:tripartite-type tricarboxylate transporter receptor subunit TctC
MKAVALIAFFLCAGLAGMAPARSESFPTHALHLVVAYAAGGTGDIVARLLADKLALALGQNVVVENRAGASGAIGTHSVVSAAPDGHTLLLGQPAEVAINQHWIKGLTYDPDTDLQPVALATIVPLALVIPANAPYATVAEMLSAAKTHPLAFASAGTGTPGHFAGELVKLRSGGNMTHVLRCARSKRSPGSARGFLLFRISGGNCPGEGRHLEAACRLDGQALTGRPGCADRRRGYRICRFRYQPVAGHIRSARDAEGRGVAP